MSIKQEILFTEYLEKEIQSGNEIWLIYVILQKKKILSEKNSTENVSWKVVSPGPSLFSKNPH